MIISPVVSNPRYLIAGGLVVVSCETRSNAGVLTTPGTSIQITLFDPTGATAQAATGMTAGSTGIYTYTYQTVVTKNPGIYTILITVIHTDGTSIFRSEVGWPCNFEVA